CARSPAYYSSAWFAYW
nr:immunoglobulin heavy chain junction region [Mus musculus]